jgi:filamentous hemagglutinin family protein
MPALPSSTATGSTRRHARHFALLASVSIMALTLASSPACAISVGSRSSATTGAPTIASDSARAMAQQAQETAQRVQQSLSRATQALRSMQDIQAAARPAAQAQQASRTVTDGLSAGGLIVDPRVAAGNSSNLSVNAKLPTQTTSNGQTTVTVQQTAQRAIATWQQFNVGRNTTLYFDQSGGNSANGNSWTILNRIDATGSPSQILGQIKAEGTVLIINPNGIIFNGTSQINVHTLIASAMDMNSFTGTANGAFKASGNAYVPLTVSGLTQTTPSGTLILSPSDEANANTVFLKNGLFVNNSLLLSSGTSTGNTALFSAGLIPGQNNIGIRVDAGASITTDVSGFDNGGFVALLGPQVANAGSIITSAGAIILAAGSSVQIAEPAANSTQTGYVTWASSGIGGTLLYTPPSVSGGSLLLNDVGGVLVSRRGQYHTDRRRGRTVRAGGSDDQHYAGRFDYHRGERDRAEQPSSVRPEESHRNSPGGERGDDSIRSGVARELQGAAHRRRRALCGVPVGIVGVGTVGDDVGHRAGGRPPVGWVGATAVRPCGA